MLLTPLFHFCSFRSPAAMCMHVLIRACAHLHVCTHTLSLGGTHAVVEQSVLKEGRAQDFRQRGKPW